MLAHLEVFGEVGVGVIWQAVVRSFHSGCYRRQADRMCTYKQTLLAALGLVGVFALVGSRDAPVIRWRSQDEDKIVITVKPFNPVLRGVVEKWTAMLELKPLGGIGHPALSLSV